MCYVFDLLDFDIIFFFSIAVHAYWCSDHRIISFIGFALLFIVVDVVVIVVEGVLYFFQFQRLFSNEPIFSGIQIMIEGIICPIILRPTLL